MFAVYASEGNIENPLASLAVGERRPTWDRPSKSQMVGLVAAALGIERIE